MERWKGQLRGFQKDASEQFYGIDRGPIKFKWNIFPGRPSLELLRKVQEYLERRNIEPGKIEINFMSMFDDIILGQDNNNQECICTVLVCHWKQETG